MIGGLLVEIERPRLGGALTDCRHPAGMFRQHGVGILGELKMANMIQVEVGSPFAILRDEAGLSLEDMARACYLKPELLRRLEARNWSDVDVGQATVAEAMFRVGCVAAVKIRQPDANDLDALEYFWGDARCELENAFNHSAF